MFYKLINLIKMNYNLKRTKLKIQTKLNNRDFIIIRLFIKFNIVKVCKSEKKTNIIYFNYVNGKPAFRNIKNLYKPSKPSFINLKQIEKFNKKKNSIFILSTNKGLITNFEAEKEKIGGILVFSIHI